MFWNDPILYGASFPYKDVPTPMQTPFAGAAMPWLNMPKFVPPYYGFQIPYFYGNLNPYLHNQAFTPFVPPYGYTLPQFNVPQLNLPQFNVPQFNLPHFNLPQLNPPQFGWTRPFTY